VSGIVYCLSRKAVESTAAYLQSVGIRALPYHAGMPAEARTAAQDAFRRDDIDVMVATVAFGMGIDKPDIRYVIHRDMPRSPPRWRSSRPRGFPAIPGIPCFARSARSVWLC